MSGGPQVELLAWAALLGCDPAGLLLCTDPTERLARVAIIQRAIRLKRNLLQAQAQMTAAEVSRIFKR